jgi:hypothetical protein
VARCHTAEVTSGRFALTAAALSGCAALAAGCGAASRTAGGAAGIVPASAPAFVAIDTDLGSAQWQTVDDLASRFPDKQKAIDSLENDLRKQGGIDWSRDVKPALGPEVDVVWLDFANNGGDVVGLTQPGDDDAFKRLVAKGNAKDAKNKLLYEKVGDWEAFADKQSLLDRFLLQSSGGGAKLGDDAGFKQATGSLSGDTLVRAYVSGPRATDELRRYAGPGAGKLFRQAGTLDWLMTDLQASSDGMRFDTVVRGTPGKLLRGAGTGPTFHAALPEHVPGNALFYLGFHGARGMLGRLGSTPQLSAPQLRPVAGLLRSVGALLQGEDAVYARQPASGQIPEVTLVAEPQAGTDGVATIDRILRKYRRQLRVRPQTTSIGGVQARTLHLGKFQLDYADLDGRFVLTDLPQGILSLRSPTSTLAGSDAYKSAVDASGLPASTQGFVYVDISGGVGLVQKLANAPIPGVVARNLKPLQSAVEYALTRPSEVHVTFFLQIK